MTQMNLSLEQNHRQREQTGRWQGEGVWGGMQWKVGASQVKLLYIEWINNKVLLYRTGNHIKYDKPKREIIVFKRNIYIQIYMYI